MISVYHYSKPHIFLKDAWLEKKNSNPAFSLRAWAKQMGLKGHAPIQLILKGQREIPKKYIPFFSESFKLCPEQSLYFEALVNYSNANTDYEKAFYMERMREMGKKRPLETIEFEHYEFLKNPLHIAILEMTSLPHFKEDPLWIKNKISFPCEVVQIKEAIERLLALNLLTRDRLGHLRKTYKHFSSKNDVKELAVKEYHKSISELAIKAVFHQDVLDREFNGYAFNIQKQDMEKAKKMIREFGQHFVREFEKENDGDETYQLNNQFVSLLKKDKRST